MKYRKIDKQEVLRYLGYQGQAVDADLDSLIDSCIAECERTAIPRTCYQLFDIEPTEGGIAVCGTSLVLRDKSIYEHLKDARRCAILAATLGAPYDSTIRVQQNQSMTKALILDACGTDYIEKVCDTVESEIKQRAAQEGLFTNFRFSPGYGDLPLEQQPQVTALLDTSRKIGLTCTPSLIMLPRKSVTAIIGFVSDPPPGQRKPACADCQFAPNCTLRKEGKFCGR